MSGKILLDRQPFAVLVLSDGSTWNISAGNERTSSLVSCLAATMQLGPMTELGDPSTMGGTEQASGAPVSCLRVVVEEAVGDQLRKQGAPRIHTADKIVGSKSGSSEPSVLNSRRALPAECKKNITCILEPAEDDNAFVAQLAQVSLVIAQSSQDRGGLLLHGALAERDGYGVILAGPGGAGKTTASQRLAPPWRSLCDDTTLVVRDKQGSYWGHPWPTWTSFMSGGAGGTWDVKYAVPLRGIFFLEQAQKKQCELVGVAQAVCLLTKSAEQVSWRMTRDMEMNQVRELRLQRFENICALAQEVPAGILRLSRNGPFWEAMEQALNM